VASLSVEPAYVKKDSEDKKHPKAVQGALYMCVTISQSPPS